MRLTEDNKGNVLCPRTNENVNSETICKHCDWLGWTACDQVVCRWSALKEKVKKGDVYYNSRVGL